MSYSLMSYLYFLRSQFLFLDWMIMLTTGEHDTATSVSRVISVNTLDIGPATGGSQAAARIFCKYKDRKNRSIVHLS